MTSSVSVPWWLLSLVGIIVLTAVHLYVPAWRCWMFGIVSTGPVWLKFPPPTLVQVYISGFGLAAVTWQVKDNVSPTIVFWSGIGCIVGRSIRLEKIIFVVYQMHKEKFTKMDNKIFARFIWSQIYICVSAFTFKVKSRKYQGVFEVKSRAKTWQVRGIWSQQLEH